MNVRVQWPSQLTAGRPSGRAISASELVHRDFLRDLCCMLGASALRSCMGSGIEAILVRLRQLYYVQRSGV